MMTKLFLTLLGGFDASLNEMPILSFESDKVRALLAYLAIEAKQPHRRESLCGLLWPDKPERLARRSLSQSLYNLRHTIQNELATPPFLLINQLDIQFNSASDYHLDTQAFDYLSTTVLDRNRSPEVARLQQIVHLYTGDLLKGFSLRDSAPFEEWLLLRRERYNRIYVDALRQLVALHQERGECEQAIHYARLWVASDPFQEDAHYLLIQLLAHMGWRSDAISHFEDCSTTLNDELGVEPTPKMLALLEQIRAGSALVRHNPNLAPIQSGAITLVRHAASSTLPQVTSKTDSFRLLARSRELTNLQERLDLALSGHGQIAFVSGEAGRGKSVLVKEFCRQAYAQHEQLIVVGGSCNAHSGVGDPYGVFRDILASLTSDSDATREQAMLSPAQVTRLCDLFPSVVQSLLEVGPDLLDIFIPAIPLLKRIAKMPGGEQWLQQLQVLSGRRYSDTQATATIQRQLFTQYMAVLERLAQQHPLLLVVDDLHWADVETIGLLFHIGCRLKDLPIMIVGCYRASEILLGHTRGAVNGQHALPSVLDELRRLFGNIEIQLRRDSDLEFVNSYLDLMPNRFENTFRQWLDRETAGNPLFVIELMKSMQAEGQIVQDESGNWKADEIVHWLPLPARVAAIADERLRRLPFNLRNLLTVASVEGDTFTAEVLAHVLSMNEQEVIHLLSGELSNPHQLVCAQGVTFVGLRRVCLYRFRQPVFRHFLYSKLDEVERPLFHEAVGEALEKIYGTGEESLIPISGQLAHHFQVIGLLDKAKHYLQLNKKYTLSFLVNSIAMGQIAQSILDQIY